MQMLLMLKRSLAHERHGRFCFKFLFENLWKLLKSIVDVQVDDYTTKIKDDVFYFLVIQFLNNVWKLVGKYLILHSQIQDSL